MAHLIAQPLNECRSVCVDLWEVLKSLAPVTVVRQQEPSQAITRGMAIEVACGFGVLHLATSPLSHCGNVIAAIIS